MEIQATKSGQNNLEEEQNWTICSSKSWRVVASSCNNQAWYWHKDGDLNQFNKSEPRNKPYVYAQLIFFKGAKTV